MGGGGVPAVGLRIDFETCNIYERMAYRTRQN